MTTSRLPAVGRLCLLMLLLLVGLSSPSMAQDFNATTNATNGTGLQADLNTTTSSLITTTRLSVTPSARGTQPPPFMASSTTTTTTTTAPTNGANIFQLKTICTCLMDSLDDSEMITCPTNFKINIVSAVLYDMNNTACEKSDNSVQAGYLNSIKEDLANYCTGTNCSISESHIINSIDIINSNRRKDVVCLSADIKWFCYQFTTTYSIVSTSSSAYGFTYFFYIITLILSSSCILIGAIFILRRFLMIRRHASQTRSRRAAQRAYSAHLAHMNYCNGGINTGGGNTNNIWTCTYAPPAYDHIYESSHPINPPPDYDATMANNMKFHYLKAEDQVVIVYPDQSDQQLQQQQVTQQQQQQQQQDPAPTITNGGENQISEFSLQPLYISTGNPSPQQVVEPSTTSDAHQPFNQIEPLSAHQLTDNGQLNLAFKPETPPQSQPQHPNSVEANPLPIINEPTPGGVASSSPPSEPTTVVKAESTEWATTVTANSSTPLKAS